MSSYAGYKDPAHFINTQLKNEGLTKNALSEEFGWRRNYLSAVCLSQFVPSAKRCDQLSKRFNQDPHILRILAGHESPPINLNQKQVREIYDLANTLTASQRESVIKFINSIKSKRRSK